MLARELPGAARCETRGVSSPDTRVPPIVRPDSKVGASVLILTGLKFTGTSGVARRFRGKARLESDDAWIAMRPEIASAEAWVLSVEAQFDRQDANGKLYIDYGDGFSEANAVWLPYRGTGSKAVIVRPEGVRALRWDPDDRRGTVVRIQSLELREATGDELAQIRHLVGTSAPNSIQASQRLTRMLAGDHARLRAGPEALDRIRFADELIERRSPLLNSAWLAAAGFQSADGPQALVELAERRDQRAFPLFDPDWYCAQAGLPPSSHVLDALRHYLQAGEALGFPANPFLRASTYTRVHDGLKQAIRANPTWSILEHIASADATGGVGPCFFDAAWYSQEYPEADTGGVGLFATYLTAGWRKGHRPNGVFDEEWYLRSVPEADRAVAEGDFPNGFSHFVMNDVAGVVHASPFFDPKTYLEINGDIGDPGKPDDLAVGFHHYCVFGRREERSADRSGLSFALARHLPRSLPDGYQTLASGGVTGPRDALLSLGTDRPDLETVGETIWRFGAPNLELTFGRETTIFAPHVTRIYVDGIASWPHARLADVECEPREGVRVVNAFTYPRLDIAESVGSLGGTDADLAAGFVVCLEIDPSATGAGEIRVPLCFAFERLGESRLVPGPSVRVTVLPSSRRSSAERDTQVLMAAYNPEAGSFGRQIDTILGGDRPVSLLISDDASPSSGLANLATARTRFDVEVEGHTTNVGFIANFERTLNARSPAAGTLLFSDQDDVWYADKVGSLCDAMRDQGAVLAYSDMRIVDDRGAVLSPTFWDTRVPHHADPVSLAVANAVTGAASAFTADLAEHLLPFPRFHEVYHDQWLAVMAAALGPIAYIDRPLYDYVQHGANVLGFAASRGAEGERWRETKLRLHRIRRALAAGRPLTDRERSTFAEVLTPMMVPTLQRYVMLQEALHRLDAWHDTLARDVAVGFCAAIEGKQVDPVRLKRNWGRLKRRSGGDRALLGIDYRFDAVLTALALLRSEFGIFRPIARMEQAEKAAWLADRARLKALANSDLDWRLAPLQVERVTAERGSPMRVNLFLPELRIKTFFGGYYSKIALAQRLIERGVRVRIIQLERPFVDYGQISNIEGAFPELIPALEGAEMIAVSGRERAIPFSPRDALLATTWWSAHVVESVRQALDQPRFSYLVQEFEPFTFHLGTYYRAAELSYGFPYSGIYSTGIMRRYFEAERIGQFAPGVDAEEGRDYLTFDNPIVKLTGREAPRETSSRKRLLVYARPQPHAARNMYEFSVAALRRAVEILGDELEDWDLVGAGADAAAKVSLGSGRELRLMRKLDAYGYRHMLATSDVGVALMYTPHPSLVPIEMASAGLVTVTNACMTKTPELMATISPEILVPDAEIGAIADAIATAVRRVNAGERPRGRIDWPSTPEGAFPDEWVDALVAMMERTLAPGTV